MHDRTPTFQFFVPGKPVGKARPRHNTKTGNTYTPKRTADYERHVRECFEAKYPLSEPVSGPVSMMINAIVPVPRTKDGVHLTKQYRNECFAGLRKPTGKPDCDNIVKIICDALNGIAYKDDKQIYAHQMEKAYSMRDGEIGCGVTVTIDEFQE